MDMKRTNTPRFNRPNNSIIQPAKNEIRAAYSGLIIAYGCTINAIIAVVAAMKIKNTIKEI